MLHKIVPTAACEGNIWMEPISVDTVGKVIRKSKSLFAFMKLINQPCKDAAGGTVLISCPYVDDKQVGFEVPSKGGDWPVSS